MLDTGECSILFHVRFELTFEINNAYFKMWGTSTLCKIATFKWIEELLYPLKEHCQC
jgi:hypothetical protein